MGFEVNRYELVGQMVENVLLIDLTEAQIDAFDSVFAAANWIEWDYAGDHLYYVISVDGRAKKLWSRDDQDPKLANGVAVGGPELANLKSIVLTYRDMVGLSAVPEVMSPSALVELWDRLWHGTR